MVKQVNIIAVRKGSEKLPVLEAERSAQMFVRFVPLAIQNRCKISLDTKKAAGAKESS